MNGGGAVQAVSIAAGGPTVKLAAEAGFMPATPEQKSSAAAASSCHSFLGLGSGRKGRGSEISGGSQEENEEEKVNGVKRLSLLSVIELIPSVEEAEAAIDALKQTFCPSASHDVSESMYSFFGMEAVDKQLASSGGQQEAVSNGKDLVMGAPSPQLHRRTFINLKELSQVQRNILNLPSLLNINPLLQRMVLSLSTDKAIWDAVMKNDTVKELKKSFLTASGLIECSGKHKAGDENSDIAKSILSWILDNIKSTLSRLIDQISLLVNEVFLQGAEQEKTIDVLDILGDITKSSLKLTLMVFIVVVIARIKQI